MMTLRFYDVTMALVTFTAGHWSKKSIRQFYWPMRNLFSDCKHQFRQIVWGRGCGAVGRAVASDTRDPQFDSRHRHCNNSIVFFCHCYPEKTKNKEKRPGMAQFFF